MDETSKPGDETKSDDAAPVEASTAPERLDEEGLPIDRALTLDDVRGEGSGRTIAIGCTALVVLATVGFWLLRYGMMH